VYPCSVSMLPAAPLHRRVDHHRAPAAFSTGTIR
jgi:hypothetical protein